MANTAEWKDWTKSESSNIRYHRYLPKKQQIQICFQNGAVWCYSPFTPEEYRAFVNAESHGKHFNQYIKNKVDVTATKKP